MASGSWWVIVIIHSLATSLTLPILWQYFISFHFAWISKDFSLATTQTNPCWLFVCSGASSNWSSAIRCGQSPEIVQVCEVFLHPLWKPSPPLFARTAIPVGKYENLLCVWWTDSPRTKPFLFKSWSYDSVFVRVHLHFWGLQHITSEKQAPSPLDYLGSLKAAVQLERRLAKPGTSKALKDLLNKSIAEYNKMCSNKRHRVDSDRKKLIQNMFLDWMWRTFHLAKTTMLNMLEYMIIIPWATLDSSISRLRLDDDIQQIVHQHYDCFPHAVSGLGGTWLNHAVWGHACLRTLHLGAAHHCASVSGLPLELLQSEWWVPGNSSRSEATRYGGHAIFRDILTTTQETCKMWIRRATQDSLCA